VDTFKPGDLILADRYDCSYFLIALLMERGVDVLFQQNAMRKTDFSSGPNVCRAIPLV
jgi:hypothetical protein